MENAAAIGKLISTATGAPFIIRHEQAVSGGCINRCHKVGNGEHSFFVKLNAADKLANLKAEYLGLMQLSAAGAVRVPKPIAVGMADGQSALVLEYLSLSGGERAGWHEMGANLARLHNTDIGTINAALIAQKASANALLPEGKFGGRISNATLGDRPGFLAETANWADFFHQNRLRFQFEQAESLHGKRFANAEKTLAAAGKILSHRPPFSLTHGDLWGGNAAFAVFNKKTTPVFFDPAPYIADAETDLAMSELFGGFPSAFYEGYRSIRTIADGYAQRRTVYNLYHVLNHFNLFGGGYLGQAERMMTLIIRGG